MTRFGGASTGAFKMRFAGYAALFDRVDRGGDVIRRGAFAQAVNEGGVPILREHDPGRRIGTVEMLAEDGRGLRVIGRIGGGPRLREGGGLSFGYRVRQSRGAGPRELIEIDLVEISLVEMPMQPGARVLMVVP